MKVKAARLHGKSDLRLETVEFPEMKADEIQARIITDSLCMSSYKAMLQGEDHRAVNDDIAERPIIIGHEFCALVEKVGEQANTSLKPGDRFTVQPKMVMGERIMGPGYSFPTYGGDATQIIVPASAIDGGYLLPYNGEGCFKASLSEPFSCIISALHSQYHLAERHQHVMGLKKNGYMAVLAGCGPMGMGMALAAMTMENKPRKIIITDVNEDRVTRARELVKGKNGVEVEVLNTGNVADVPAYLIEKTGGHGFDDVIIMAPVPAVIEQADAITGTDSCISFFAGPTRKDFFAKVNFYDVHYNDKHIIGTSGGDTDDMRETLEKIETGAIRAEVMVTHVGGLNAAVESTMNLPKIPGAKKLLYCNIDMPLTAISDFGKLGETDPLFAKLDELCRANDGLWSKEAEDYLLANAPAITV